MIFGLTGHQKLPDSVADYARSRLREMRFAEDVIGVCSLAAGADQLFAEVVLDLGGRLWAVIPANDYETTFDDPGDLDKFERLVTDAERVERLNFAKPSEQAFYAAGLRVVDLCDKLYALWDGKKARGLGGTGDIVTYAREQGKPTDVLWLDGVARD